MIEIRVLSSVRACFLCHLEEEEKEDGFLGERVSGCACVGEMLKRWRVIYKGNGRSSAKVRV